MTDLAGSRPALGRWLALVVRYWAYNMNLIHERGACWPGFGYTDHEKAEMGRIAHAFSLGEFLVWLGLCATFFIVILLAFQFIAMKHVATGIGTEPNVANTPAAIFFLSLSLEALASLTVGFPLAMLPAAALAGSLYGVADSDLPDAATTAHYFHKLWFQIARMAVIAVIAVIPLWLYVPWDSRFMVIARIVIPLLAPTVASLTGAYYLSARLQRSGRNTGRDS